ncbi:hypothetical protein VTK26DRAFT_4417 [Humicola hyalothermophila]
MIHHPPILPHNQPQLAARLVLPLTPKHALPHRVRVQLVGRVVGVDEPDDLLVRHAAPAALRPQLGLLLQPPVVHERHVRRVDVHKGVEPRVDGRVVGGQLLVDEEEVVELVVVQRAGRARRPSRLDGARGQRAEADAPAFEEEDGQVRWGERPG